MLSRIDRNYVSTGNKSAKFIYWFDKSVVGKEVANISFYQLRLYFYAGFILSNTDIILKKIVFATIFFTAHVQQ